MALDIVYPVRPGDRNEELRYSLRSLEANLPHGQVFIVGYKPSWLTNVAHVHREQRSTKYMNANLNLVAAAYLEELSDPFILMNDDFYVMKRMRKIPILHRGPLEDVIEAHRSKPRAAYVRGMLQTRGLLRVLGITSPLSYELHTPMPMHKAFVIRAWQLGNRIPCLHIRTMVGNLGKMGGRQIPDVKVYRDTEAIVGFQYSEARFLSTNDSAMNNGVGLYIKDSYPLPSRYEAEG